MQKQSFEQNWRKRFARFANQSEDDAGIAGWSKTGLATRVRRFSEIWSRSDQEIKWLDAGCGAGTYSELLDSGGVEVIAFDYSLIALQKGKQRYPPTILWGVADVTQLPLQDHCVDGALCFGVTQVLSSSQPAIEELMRVVKPGGQIWIDGLNSWCLPHLWEQLSRKLQGLDPHLRYESPWKLRQLARQQGLQDVRLHWLSIAPSRLAKFQWILDSTMIKQLCHYLPVIGALLSHSMVIQAENKLPNQQSTRSRT
ncbi:MAG: class I SAM-dependent methyltransferase [Methylococcales bacterium]